MMKFATLEGRKDLRIHIKQMTSASGWLVECEAITYIGLLRAGNGNHGTRHPDLIREDKQLRLSTPGKLGRSPAFAGCDDFTSNLRELTTSGYHKADALPIW